MSRDEGVWGQGIGMFQRAGLCERALLSWERTQRSVGIFIIELTFEASDPPRLWTAAGQRFRKWV